MIRLVVIACLVLAGTIRTSSGQETASIQDPKKQLYERIKDDETIKQLVEKYSPQAKEARARLETLDSETKATFHTQIACYLFASKHPDGAAWSALLSDDFANTIRRLEEQYSKATSTETPVIAKQILFYNQLLLDLCESQSPRPKEAEVLMMSCRERIFDYKGANVEALELLAKHYVGGPETKGKAISVYEQLLFYQPQRSDLRSQLVELLIAAKRHAEVNSHSEKLLDQFSYLAAIRDPHFTETLKILVRAPVEEKVKSAGRELTDFARNSEGIVPPDKLVFYASLDSKVVPFNFILVKSGDYFLGMDADRRLLGARESNDFTFGATLSDARSVRVAKPFYILDREVTAAQWSVVMSTPLNDDADLPKGRVSWFDAAIFCKLLPGSLGVRARCRLPTEWEWECSGRAGKDFYFPWGPESIELPKELKKVDNETRDKTPSGIYHLAGNLREWCINDAEEKLKDDRVLAIDERNYEFEVRTEGASRRLYQGGEPVPETTTKAIKGGCAGLDAVYLQLPIRRPALASRNKDEYGFRPVIIP